MGVVEPIDWVARWRATVEAREEQGRRLDTQHARADAWAGRAERFARYAAESAHDDPLLERVRAYLEDETRREFGATGTGPRAEGWVAAGPADAPGDDPARLMTVLDVGAGPGRHTLPLARVARRVTAVEPSDAMRALLVANAPANVDVVPERWPEAWEGGRVTPADVVVCSHVVYPVAEIAPFLRALDLAARRTVFLALRIDQREAPFMELFARVWGEPRCPAPTALDLLQVCHQLGLAAAFEPVPFPGWRSYASLDDAVAQVRQEVLNPEGADETIRGYLADHLVEREGRLVLPDPAPPRAAILSWRHVN